MDNEINQPPLSNKYCPLCGVVLMWEEFEELPESRRPWYAEVRAAAKQDHHEYSMTGVGILDSRDCLFAPMDEELDYMNATEMEEVELFRTESDLHGFGLHDSCWMLLQDRLWHTIDSSKVAQSLYDQFYCIPCPLLSSLRWGHDYGGAERWHKPYGMPMPVDLPLLFQADPYMVPLLEKIEENAPAFSDGQAYDTVHPRSSIDLNIGYSNSLGKLSLELLHEVISYLSTQELLNLRCTSRALARRIIFQSLPPSFWKRQFTLGYGMDFLFPDLEHKRDWFRLYRGTMAYLKTDDKSSESLSLLNRRRIRALVEPIASLVELDIRRSKEPRGRRANCAELKPGQWVLTEGLTTLPAENVYTAVITSETEYLPHGCHTPRYRISTFPSQMPNGGEIKVSTVKLGARVFISGISHHPHNTEIKTEDAVGHEYLPGQKTIKVPPNAISESIEVAFCPEGLRGIRFHLSESIVSEWAGDIDDEEMSYGVLRIPLAVTRTYNLLAGSDAYKLTAIGIVNGDPQDQKARSDRALRNGPDLSLAETYLWRPHRPNYKNLRISQFQPNNTGMPYRPLTDIDFGGPDGMWLASLTGMEVYVLSTDSPIVGMTFNYTDKILRFGTHERGQRLQFLIDGPRGERITDVVAAGHGSEEASCLYAFRITTNYDREMDFGPSEVRPGDCVPPKYEELFERSREGLITGFVTTQRWNEKHYAQMGIQVRLLDAKAATNVASPQKSTLPPLVD